MIWIFLVVVLCIAAVQQGGATAMAIGLGFFVGLVWAIAKGRRDVE